MSAGGWEPLTPAEVATLLAGFPARWWIAGGLALDLFAGHRLRDHEDVDVSLLRGDQEALRAHLADWDLQMAGGGRLEPWRKQKPVAAGASLWARHEPSGPWRAQFLLETHDADVWRYRRDPTISLPVAEIGRLSPEAIPYLCPEIVLLSSRRRSLALATRRTSRQCSRRSPTEPGRDSTPGFLTRTPGGGGCKHHDPQLEWGILRLSLEIIAPISVNLERRDPAVGIVNLIGEHDAFSAVQLENKLAVLLDGGVRVVVDLREATFIDSQTLSILLSARHQAEAASLGFALVLDEDEFTQVHRLFDLTGLGSAFAIYPTLQEATAASRAGKTAGAHVHAA